MRFTGLSIVACLILSAPAGAQTERFTALMRDVNARVPAPDPKLVEADALATLQAIAASSGGCSPATVSLAPLSPASSDLLAVTGVQAGQLSNMWLTQATPGGCADALPTRMMVIAFPDGKVIARVLNRGDSLAWPTLMRDTMTPAAVLAHTKVIRSGVTDCDPKQMAFLDTRIVAKSDDLAPDFYGTRFAGSWDELWRFGVCGHVVEVPVKFTTDGNGGANYHLNDKASVIVSRPGT